MSLDFTVGILLALLVGGVRTTENTKRCKLFAENSNERKALSLLEPLTNKNFSLEVKNKEDTYTYIIQVCGDADGVTNAGVVQRDKSQKQTRIGNYNATQAIQGSDWVMLIYTGGEKYDTHCSGEQRKAIVMISCNKQETKLSLVLEDRERQRDCFYLFELDTPATCPVVESKLSAGSIVLIIGFSCLAVYLIGGFLYLRLVVGAKGVEQFPNYAFWKEVGNLSADGCDFMCRSRGSREDAPEYRGAATEPLGEEPEERDDHLLPM